MLEVGVYLVQAGMGPALNQPRSQELRVLPGLFNGESM